MSRFVHLKVHTEYSLIDSIVRVGPLVASAERLGMPAVAVTDQGNVSAMVKLYRAASERGIKPLIGADLLIGGLDDGRPVSLSLLCANQRGFKSLSRLLTRSAREGHSAVPCVRKDWLTAETLDGLIGLSGAQHGELGHVLASSHPRRAIDVLAFWAGVMPSRFYVELQRLGRPGEIEYVQQAVDVAARLGVPVVATNDVRFIERSEFEAHETRVCIAQSRTLTDSGRPRDYTEEQYLKSAAEMGDVFADLPEALDNAFEIAKRCTLELDFGRVYLPKFPVAKEHSPAEHLRQRAVDGLRSRLEKSGIAASADYEARLGQELDVIIEMGFEGYFLIVADFIAWSRANSIPVGPGRGSGAGSLVAYALGITNLDPIEHDLLFERFLNPERVSLPDFDIDFCIDGRDRVIEYVSERYGRDRVSQIITYGTMAARAVVRDVGRVLGMPYGYIDRIAKLIPFEIGITLERALAEEDELRALYESEEDVRSLIDLAQQLEGLARNAGTHAGGVVIAPDALTEFMPLYSDEHGAALTQLDKDDLEAIGLVKFDFLGLKTLTIIDRALRTVNSQRAADGIEPIELDAIALDDAKTYALLNTCQTTAIFQLESRGMRDLIKRLRPDCFEDLVAILALFRPGPLQSGMVDEFIARKHGGASAVIDYLHPSLKSVLLPTYGVILYQEQVMQIAQVLAGYSLGGADLLRRAMGKKKPDEMAKQRSIFQAGAQAKDVPPGQASHIFDLMEKFAGYGFNKSHSAAYALIAYHTAWLKAHYPAAFMAAAMTADIDNTDKLVVLKDDCKAMGIELAPPDVNRSVYEFAVADPRHVKYGLGAIKGVGRGVVEAIVDERTGAGPYTSLLDFCRRVGPQRLNRRLLEALVRSGALDSLGMNRATLMNAIPDALKLADTALAASAAGQATLFGSADALDGLEHEFAELREWSAHERLEAERESLGLYLTGHPFSNYAGHCDHFTHGRIASVLGSCPDGEGRARYRRDVAIAGVVMDIRRRGSRVSIVLDDDTDRIEVTLFEEAFQAARHVVSKHAVLVVSGQLRFDDFLNAWRLNAQRVQSVDEAIESRARLLKIKVDADTTGPEFLSKLRETLTPFRNGACKVCVQYRNRGARAELTLGEGWCVHPSRELRERLSSLVGETQVSVHYPRHLPSA